jgi:hypothetical protein
MKKYRLLEFSLNQSETSLNYMINYLRRELFGWKKIYSKTHFQSSNYWKERESFDSIYLYVTLKLLKVV